ncbi:MAG: hypothetical protein R2789_09935 [Microthrixaceae bacterium]
MVLALTAVATVAFDLILAVEIGVVVAAFLALRSVARTTTFTHTHRLRWTPKRSASCSASTSSLIASMGALFFGATQRFLNDLARVSDVRVIILRLPDLQVLDATGAQAIGEMVEDLERRKIVLLKWSAARAPATLQSVGGAGQRREVNTTCSPGWMTPSPTPGSTPWMPIGTSHCAPRNRCPELAGHPTATVWFNSRPRRPTGAVPVPSSLRCDIPDRVRGTT